MTYKNIYYNTKENKIHLWEQIKGENFYDEVDWTPYCFVRDKHGDVETIDGKKVSKKNFRSYKDYMKYCKENKSGLYENNVSPVIQFLAERYYNLQTEEMIPPDLKIYAIDIEVHTGEKKGDEIISYGFPEPKVAERPIVLISVMDFTAEKIYCFGDQPITTDFPNYNYEYFPCKDEYSLLKSFYGWWRGNIPDVVTGWNISADYKVNTIGGFDFPYIINRTKNIFGTDTNIYKKLSPLNIVSMHYKEDLDSYIVDIAGVSILDYMSLYKWYTNKNLESYSLETVARHELDKGKVEYENNLVWLYYNDWNKYVEYNMEDVFLIKELEDKLKYMRLAQSLALLCKCQMKMFSSTTNLIEGLLLTRYRRSGKCAPFFSGGDQTRYPAAHVKSPQVNKHSWLFSLDIASSYPFAIITCNMSIETLYGKILNMEEKDIIKCVYNKEFPEIRIDKNGEVKHLVGKDLKTFNNALKKKLLSVAPNGVMFYNKPTGVYAQMERDIYLKRKELQNKKDQKWKEYETTKDPKIKQEAENFHTNQWALKIVINGAYGITAVPYSRYFSPYMAEAVTAVGRYSLQSGETYINEIMNDPNEELMNILNEISNNI